MSPARPPSMPPRLPGFHHVQHLGSGGFADVFLYEEQLLGRKVAVKVLLSGKLGADAIKHFTNEANLMAQLSNHPSIVSVYQAAVAEDGRPYIVMEYCSRPNLQVRYRAKKFSEAETLRIGIQIAGAVETAHRAGILHRDIKPANILVTDYDRPALTDFGIAATTSAETQGGMSVPWAPPESFLSDGRSDPRSDVYSLAATLYTLLAGRTPFERPGTSSSSIDLMDRIQKGELAPITRHDVSASLGRVLATAMAVKPENRYASAMEFARALQRVQIELGMQSTPVDVVEDSPESLDADDDDGLTRFRSVVTIDAQQPTARTLPPTVPYTTGTQRLPATPSVPMSPEVAATQLGYRPAAVPMPTAPPVDETQLRAPARVEVSLEAPEPATEVLAPRTRTRLWLAIGAAVAVAGLAVTLLVTVNGQQSTSAAPSVAPTVQPIDAAPKSGAVPQVSALKGSVDGKRVTFTWTNPDPQEGDTYLWRPKEIDVEHNYELATTAKVTTPKVPDGKTCVEVVLRRANGKAADQPALGCVS